MSDRISLPLLLLNWLGFTWPWDVHMHVHTVYNLHWHIHIDSHTHRDSDRHAPQTWLLFWTNPPQLLQGAISRLTFSERRTVLVHIYCSLERRLLRHQSRDLPQPNVCHLSALSVCHQGCCPRGAISRPLCHCLSSHCAGQLTCAGSGNAMYHVWTFSF